MKDTRGRIAKIICYSYQMLKSIVTWLLYKIKLKIIGNKENNIYQELNRLTNSLIIYLNFFLEKQKCTAKMEENTAQIRFQNYAFLVFIQI